jgi:hypothetical protein
VNDGREPCGLTNWNFRSQDDLLRLARNLNFNAPYAIFNPARRHDLDFRAAGI